MKTHGGIPRICNLALDGGVISITLRRLYSLGRVPGIHWLEDWVGARACSDKVVKKKIRAGNQTLVFQFVASYFRDSFPAYRGGFASFRCSAVSAEHSNNNKRVLYKYFVS